MKTTVYVLDKLDALPHGWYEKQVSSLPSWRAEKVLSLKKQEDRLRSVLAFALLEKALESSCNIHSVPEFSYGKWGKPYFENCPIHFSLSHCKAAVACALSDTPVGVDVQDTIPFSPALAAKICSEEERAQLEDAPALLTRFWTEKEALAKKEGKGLHADFRSLQGEVLSVCREKYCLAVSDKQAQIKDLSVEDFGFSV